MTTATVPDSMRALVFGPKRATTGPLQALAETAKQVIATVAENVSEVAAQAVEAQVIPLRGGGAVVVATGDAIVPAMVVPVRKTTRSKRRKTSNKRTSTRVSKKSAKKSKRTPSRRTAKKKTKVPAAKKKKKAAKLVRTASRSKSRVGAKSRRG